MTEELKELLVPIQRYFEREFGDTLGFNWDDLHHVHLAYTEDEDPPYAEMQVEADLIDYKFRFFYGGVLECEESTTDSDVFRSWLESMTFDELIRGCRNEQTRSEKYAN